MAENYQRRAELSKLIPCSYSRVLEVGCSEDFFVFTLSKDWEYENYGILDRTHLRFFTEKSLKNTILKNKYITEKFHGISSAIIKPRNLKGVASNMLILLICLFLFGYFGDIRFKQLGFRIKPDSFEFPPICYKK